MKIITSKDMIQKRRSAIMHKSSRLIYYAVDSKGSEVHSFFCRMFC